MSSFGLRSTEEICIPCQTNSRPAVMLMKYLWNLTLVTAYLISRGTKVLSEGSCLTCGSTCPELASFIFMWAVTLWLCGRNLTPSCLVISCKLAPIYHMIAIPVLSSVLHRLVWYEMIAFMKVLEYILYNSFAADDDDMEYQSLLDPSLAVNLSDILAVAALTWVLKSYAIFDCVVTLINRLTGCPIKPISCVSQDNDLDDEEEL